MNNVKSLGAVAAAKTNGQAPKLAEVKTEAKEISPKNQIEQPPIEDRLHRLNVLFDLQKKHAKWQESKKLLEEFEVAQNKENSSLELTDDEGNEFSTKNPVVIAEVIKLVLQTITLKTKELEAQIVF